MKTKNRIFAIFALIFNILIIGAVGYGLFIAFTEAPNKLELLKYFTIDSNFLLGIAALMMIPNNIAKIANPERPYIHFFKNLKFIAVVSTSITLVTAYAFLGLNGSFGTYFEATLGGTEFMVIITSQVFYLHTFAPFLGIVSEIFDKDEKPKYKTVVYGFIPLAIYTIPYVVFAVVPGLKAQYHGDWYLFLSYTLISSNDIANTAVLTLIAIAAEFLVALLFGTIVWALILIGANSKPKPERVTYSYVGPKDEPKQVEEPVKEEAQPEETAQEPQEESIPVEETPVEEPTEEVEEEPTPVEEEVKEEDNITEPVEETSKEEVQPEEVKEESEDVPEVDEEEPQEQSVEETSEEQQPDPEESPKEESLEPEAEKEKRLQEMVKDGLISQEEYDQLMNKPEEKPEEEKKIWPFQKKKEKKGFAKKTEDKKENSPKEEKKAPVKKPAAKKAAPAKKEPAKKAEPKKEPKKTTSNKSSEKGGTKVAVAKKEAPKKEAPKKEAAPAKKTAAKKEEPAKFNGKARVYHISQHENGYKVKLAGGEKAIKTFKTQKEAIAYAKELVKTQGGTYLIHSLDGSIRKG